MKLHYNRCGLDIDDYVAIPPKPFNPGPIFTTKLAPSYDINLELATEFPNIFELLNPSNLPKNREPCPPVIWRFFLSYFLVSIRDGFRLHCSTCVV